MDLVLTMIRPWVVAVSVAAGVGFGLTLATACSSDCGCSATTPLLAGEFKVDTVELSSGADDDLRDVTVTNVVVNERTVDVLYHRDGQPGAVTYRANFRSVNGFSEVLDSAADGGSDAGSAP